MGQTFGFGKQTFVGRMEGRMEDKYEKLEELGAGAYASVIRVRSRSSGTEYACKVLVKQGLCNIETFDKEIDILIKIDHPNIIKLYEVYEDEDTYYLIMELCTGGELFDKLMEKTNSGKGFTEKEAAVIFKQLMLAINYCHTRKISHRDLKPENLLLLSKDENSPIKVIDFGLSKIFTEDDDIAYETVGTAFYVSPEVLSGCYDQSCDIWSSGVILYVLLSGQIPFSGDDDEEIFAKIKAKEFSFPDDKWLNISEDAKDLIRKMICDPSERITADGALRHNWVLNEAPKSSNTMIQMDLQAIKAYKTVNPMKKAVMTYIASRLSETEVNAMKQVFQSIDENGDGMLSLDEMKNGIDQLKGINIDNVEELFQSIDTDNSGVIDYTEFISATMDDRLYMKEEKLKDAFRLFDTDDSGSITREEIRNLLKSDDYPVEAIDAMIDKYDTNGDGCIDYEEFLCLMKEM